MLSQGYSFNELSGKDNPQTGELRFIEQIVGPIQSTYLGNISPQDFEQYISHLDFPVSESLLSDCLAEIGEIIEHWEQMALGEQLALEWKL
jgi:hypothetical protein